MVKLSEFFGLKLDENVKLEDYVLIKSKLVYDPSKDDMTKINYAHDTLSLCRTILITIDNIIAYPQYDLIAIICKKKSFLEVKKLVEQIGLKVMDDVEQVKEYDFEIAVWFSLKARMSPDWIEIKLKTKSYLFKSSDFFDPKIACKECVELIKLKLIDNKLNFYLMPRVALNVNHFKIEKLHLSSEIIQNFKSDNQDFLCLIESSAFFSIPELHKIKIKIISKSFEQLAKGQMNLESLIDYWFDRYGIRIPVNQESSSNQIYYCLNEENFIFPSCCLLHDKILIKKNNRPFEFMLEILVDLKKVWSKCELFSESETNKIKFSNANTLKNMLLIKESILDRLNNDMLNLEAEKLIDVKITSSKENSNTNRSKPKSKSASVDKNNTKNVLKNKENEMSFKVKLNFDKKPVKRRLEQTQDNENIIPVKKSSKENFSHLESTPAKAGPNKLKNFISSPIKN